MVKTGFNGIGSENMYTIITVCFNAADALEQTLLSVLAQKNCEIEYIIKDGASSDHTKAVVQKYEPELQKLKHFVFVSEKDSGIYDAMNIATKMAQGDRLQFLNAGDCLIDENVLSSIAARECDADILYGDYTSVLGQKTVANKANSETVPNFERKMNFSHQAAFIKREVMQDLLYDTGYPICADLEFFQRAYAHGKTFRYIDVMTVAFQLGGTSYQRAFELLDETYRIQYKYGIISESECNRLRRRNQLKKFSRQLIPAWLYLKLKEWKLKKG